MHEHRYSHPSSPSALQSKPRQVKLRKRRVPTIDALDPQLVSSSPIPDCGITLESEREREREREKWERQRERERDNKYRVKHSEDPLITLGLIPHFQFKHKLL